MVEYNYLWSDKFLERNQVLETTIVHINRKTWYSTISSCVDKTSKKQKFRVQKWQKRKISKVEKTRYNLAPKSGYWVKDELEWQRVRDAIDASLEGREINNQVITSGLETENNEEILKNRLLKAKNQLAIKENELVTMRTRLEKKHQSVLLSNFSRMKKEIKVFQELLTNFSANNLKEEDLQKFLTKAPWIFGLDYKQIIPKKEMPKGVADFYLERYDGFADILELKLPTDELFTKEGEISAKMGKTITQVIEYLEMISTVSKLVDLSSEYNIQSIKCKGFIVLGRFADKKEKEKLRVINSYLNGITILTYDDLLDKGNQNINTLGNKPQKVKVK